MSLPEQLSFSLSLLSSLYHVYVCVCFFMYIYIHIHFFLFTLLGFVAVVEVRSLSSSDKNEIKRAVSKGGQLKIHRDLTAAFKLALYLFSPVINSLVDL